MNRSAAGADHHFRAILEAALDAIVSMDARGRITAFNPAAERMFGIAAAAALGRPLEEVMIPSAQRAAHLAGLARCNAGGASRILGQRIELAAQRADGTPFPVELTVIAHGVGEDRAFTANLRDISERRGRRASAARGDRGARRRLRSVRQRRPARDVQRALP